MNTTVRGGDRSGEFFHLLPTARLAGFEHGVADVLRLEGLSERRAGWFAGFKTFDKVGYLMDEAVFVADLKPWHPPVFHIGVLSVANMDALPATGSSLV